MILNKQGDEVEDRGYVETVGELRAKLASYPDGTPVSRGYDGSGVLSVVASLVDDDLYAVCIPAAEDVHSTATGTALWNVAQGRWILDGEPARPQTSRRYVGFVGCVPDGYFGMLASSAAGDTSPDALEEVRAGGLDWIHKHPLEPWAELAIYELVEVVAVGPEGD